MKTRDSVSENGTDLLWFVLWLVVVVPQSPVPPLPPGVKGSVLQDTGTVGGTAGDIHHLLTLHGLYELRGVHVTAGEGEGRGEGKEGYEG